MEEPKIGIGEEDRLKRWRLILGGAAETVSSLDAEELRLDSTLSMLYNRDPNSKGRGTLSASAPMVHRWLGDINRYFPKSVVRIMQKDALSRLGLDQLLMQPELLNLLEPDISLVATLVSLSSVMPAQTKSTARVIVRKLVDELMAKLALKTRQAILGSLNRTARSSRPKYGDLDFDRTIRRNMKNWQPDKKCLIVDRPVGYGRKQKSLRDVILCVDQSGSMQSSIVYSSVFAAVLGTIKSISTKLIVFDTSVVDLSDLLVDPVEVLFGTQLAGGTDINRALAYCQKLVTRPNNTILVLITDLYDGGNVSETLQRAQELVRSGVQVICLLALNDDGAPDFDEELAGQFADLGIPAFACTPDKFPDLMAAAINKQDLVFWAGQHGIRIGADIQSKDSFSI